MSFTLELLGGSFLEEKPNNFVRILIVIIGLALCVMAFLSFSLADPKYQITAGIITLIAFVIVLALSESFNNLSVGKVISLNKEIKNKEVEKKQVKEENQELRQELFKIVSNIQQSQVNNTYNAPSDEWLKVLGVVKSQDEVKEEEQEEEQKEIQKAVEYLAERDQRIVQSRQRMKIRRSAESIAINKYATDHSIPDSELILKVEFSQSFDEIDPIMNKRVVFDAYLKASNHERFIIVKPKNFFSPMFFDRLYLMLNKIYLYRKAKGIAAELVLILVDIEGEDASERPYKTERIYDDFQPAISNKLLKIESVSVLQREIEGSEKESQPSLF